MRLTEIRGKIKDGTLGNTIRSGSLKNAIYQYVLMHSDEVFSSKEIEKIFKESKSATVRGTIQNVYTDGLLMRVKFNGSYVYGTKMAIDELKEIIDE